MSKKFEFDGIIFQSVDDVTDTWNRNVDDRYKVKPYAEVKGTMINDILITDEMAYFNAYDMGNIEQCES